ncbi:hypothetical protein ON010_g13715 [Phytophthora cinnamomi]|nr:hypothetical protein ON010_g13715 [Phytophthora cinnamomi]
MPSLVQRRRGYPQACGSTHSGRLAARSVIPATVISAQMQRRDLVQHSNSLKRDAAFARIKRRASPARKQITPYVHFAWHMFDVVLEERKSRRPTLQFVCLKARVVRIHGFWVEGELQVPVIGVQMEAARSGQWVTEAIARLNDGKGLFFNYCPT